MERLNELNDIDAGIKAMESYLAMVEKVYKADGTVTAGEQTVLDAIKTKIQEARIKYEEKKKAYLALFNDTDLDVDSDDVTVTKIGAKTNGTKVILTPVKPNGKTIYFFFGYTLGSVTDMKMRDEELENLEDDVIDAAERGFKVIYDKSGTSKEFEEALYDSSCYGIYWSGHGFENSNGTIQTSDGKSIKASDFDPNKVSSNLKFLIFAACQSGKGKDVWEKLIHKKASEAEFQGWVQNTNTSETNDFTEDTFIDSVVSHNGTNPSKELDDYIDDAEDAK